MEILGIDIGGTGIKGAIVNTETGELTTERHRIPTPKGAKPNDIAEVIAQMVKHFDWKGKVGCGFPTIISSGKARAHGNLDPSWVGIQIDQLFKDKTGLDFYIVNDADAAGLAEVKVGVGKDKMGVVLMVTIGTGIGSGLFMDGKLVPNLELGTIPYKNYERIELYASDSARKRDDITLKKWAKRFDKCLKLAVNTFSPDLVILGGGISKKFDKFEDEISVTVPVVPAMHKNNAGIIGAAMSAAE